MTVNYDHLTHGFRGFIAGSHVSPTPRVDAVRLGLNVRAIRSGRLLFLQSVCLSMKFGRQSVSVNDEALNVGFEKPDKRASRYEAEHS
jgi:hypothetical protein